MTLAELEEKFADYGSGGYYLLETFILQLLKIDAAADGRPLVYTNDGRRVPCDAFAPNGLGVIAGPLLIEIVSTLTSRSVERLASSLKKYDIPKDTSLLVICFRRMSADIDDVTELADAVNGKLYLWDNSNLEILIKKHKEDAVSLSEKLFSLRLQNAIKSEPESWRENRVRVIREVSSHYNAGRFSLMLGAGVSSSAGLPDWNTLLNSLFVSMLTDVSESAPKSENEHVSSIVRRLRQVDGPSALTLARYIRSGMTKGSSIEQNTFVDSVTRKLYGLRDGRRSIASSLIKAIVDLCAPSRTGAKVVSIITYNFDDLIERELKARNLVHRSIFEDIELAGPDELPVYHVHGFLPEDRASYPNIQKSTLVFSEEGYHKIYRDAYHWSNLVQLGALRDTSCLMIGLSLTDPNLRRLLEISVKSPDKPKHFAFLRRVSVDEFMKVDGKNVVSASKGMVEGFLVRHHALNEQVLLELGVTVIWFDEFDEIPGLLKEISKGRMHS